MSCLKTVQFKGWKQYRFLTDNHISETSYRKLYWKFYMGRFSAIIYLYLFVSKILHYGQVRMLVFIGMMLTITQIK